MPARGMAADVQPVLVHAVILGMPPEPATRAQHLLHDVVHRNLRTEVVIDHGQRYAAVDQGRRKEGEITLVERAPVAAVDEHEAAAVAFARREEVHRLARHVAVAQIQVAGHRAARTRRGFLPTREVLSVVRNQLAVVVFLVQEKLARRVHPRFSLHSPIASCPGRSEKEKSTVWSLASISSGAQEGTTNVSRGSKSNRSAPIFALPAPSTTEKMVPSVQRYALVRIPFGRSWMNAAMVGIAWPPVSGLVNCIFQPWQGSGSWSRDITSSASRLRSYG